MKTHRFTGMIALMLILIGVATAGSIRAGGDEVQRIESILNALHAAASKADGQRYFDLFTNDAVFLGTDATERWPIAEFKAYAMKRFETGTGWAYTLRPDSRHVDVEKSGDVAWFDELLDNAKYGVCRGTGVLRKVDGQWKIAQYHLAIPVPNEVALDVVKMIRDHERGANKAAEE